MVTELETLAEFETCLLRSGLLSAQQLAEHRSASLAEGESGRQFALRLVRHRLLTPFQAQNLIEGRHKGFFFAGKYKALAFLGAGGVGQILLAEHLLLARLMAVKMLKPEVRDLKSDTIEQRFLREARAVAALDHPNIVRVHDMDVANGVHYLGMEYVDGENLHRVVARHGPMAPERAAQCAAQAARGLEHACRAGLIHRDIKPGNLLLDRAGVVKVADLGLARFAQELDRNQNLTAQFDKRSVVGTAEYIAPEQALDHARADIRSDLYALGGALRYLLTGQAPFGEGNIAEQLLRRQTRDPQPLAELRPGLPEGLVAVADKLMARDPADRYQTPSEAFAALAPFAPPKLVPPPAAEMPKVSAGAYQLGLAPPDGHPRPKAPAAGSPGPASMVAGPSAATPSAADPFRSTMPMASSASGHPSRIAPPPSEPLTPFRDAGPASALPRKRTLAAVAVAVFALAGLGAAFGVWWMLPRLVAITDGLGTPPGARPPKPSLDTDAAAKPAPPPPTSFPVAKAEPPPPANAGSRGKLAAGGSTFIQPLVQHWSGLYEQAAGVRIDYAGVGSGKGVAGLKAGTYALACSDAPLSDAALAEARATGKAIAHVPLALGAVVPAYNLPDVAAPLRLTGPALADIWLGKIARWNAPPIAIANPGVALPDLPILPVHRSDSSGTTAIFTEYLSKVSGEFRTRVGGGNAVAWPLGAEGKGNGGVADNVARNVGAIGYVELNYALENGLKFAQVKNRGGRFVTAAPDTVSAAAEGNFPADLRFSLTDAPGDDAYPIAGATWALLPAKGDAEAKAFLRWAIGPGQREAQALRYAPLPENLRKQALAVLDAAQ